MSKRYKLGKKSKRNLIGVNPVLAFFVVEVMKKTTQDFTVFEGVRLKKLQRKYIKRGVSWTMRSKHLTGNAVDLVVWASGAPYWNNTGPMQDVDAAYLQIAAAAREVIKKHNLPIDWGYDLWGKDKPHWQMRKTDAWDISTMYTQKRLERPLKLRS